MYMCIIGFVKQVFQPVACMTMFGAVIPDTVAEFNTACLLLAHLSDIKYKDNT